MALNLKEQRENFVKMDFETKRAAVATILEGVKEQKEIFSDLYNLITSDHAIEQDFYDVFDSLMVVLYREEKTNEKEALDRLGSVKTRLESEKTKEIEESKRGHQEAEELLTEMA